MVVCIALAVDDVSRGALPALIYPGGRVTWKVLGEYNWSPTTTQSVSFYCTAASSTPIRVVTREVRYIHDLSLTLEHSMPISNPATLGLTLGTIKYLWQKKTFIKQHLDALDMLV